MALPSCRAPGVVPLLQQRMWGVLGEAIKNASVQYMLAN